MYKLVTALLVVVIAAPCAAMEIPFRDGSAVEALSYTVTGSYVMIEMPGGGKVAYDVADIDLDALREAEAALAGTGAVAEDASETLGRAGALTMPEETPSGGLSITDQNVKHVRGSGIAGPEDETEGEGASGDDAVPEGFEEGGGVLLNNVAVKPLEGGQWQVTGDVINRTSESVMDVRANLQAAVPDGEPWTASVPVSGFLAPDEKATFTHLFSAPSSAAADWAPQVQVSVVWMKGETRLEPRYDRMPQHPSSLPQDRGGVGGVETREDEEIEL